MHDYDGNEVEVNKNFHGWVNPQDLVSMPQCIAQVNHDTWLEAMSDCTHKRCTSYFIFCTHWQWLTELSCLSSRFSPRLIREYFDYCDRSVLSKVQLYNWVRNITGRTWLVEVGDTNGLLATSRHSILQEGHAAVDVIDSAPSCLTRSRSAPSREWFQYVMGSCSFTDTTQHIGRADRAWEYRASPHSMVALDYETAGYDLIGGHLPPGEYFDRHCFCDNFQQDFSQSACGDTGLDSTKERLWLNATCGPSHLPDHWEDDLRTVGSAYKPMKGWKWPTCVVDVPEEIIDGTDRCATDACRIDSSSGYCRETSAVDTACFCQGLSYNSSGGSCHIFEGRINYVEWLHDLCGNVQGWEGLPQNWPQLASPTPLEMIPWQWTFAPVSDTEGTDGTCPSNEWKLMTIVLINIMPLLLALFRRREMPASWNTSEHLRDLCLEDNWPLRGLLAALPTLVACLLNAHILVTVIGYQGVSVLNLTLLLCTLPRVRWLTSVLPYVREMSKTGKDAATAHSPSPTPSTIASTLAAEALLQIAGAPYMLLTLGYGVQHSLYFRNLDNADGSGPAKAIYFGALLWLVYFILLLCATKHAARDAEFGNMGQSAQGYRYILNERTPLLSKESPASSLSLNTGRVEDQMTLKTAAMIQFVLWLSQCLFWGGFIYLSSEL